MKTVYILGAGCSNEDGVPLINDFFTKIEELLDTKLEDDEKAQDFRRLLTLKNNYFKDYNIEEFFSILDFFISLEMNIPPYSFTSSRNNLILLIAKTIKLCLNDTDKSKNYEELYSKRITGDDIIISLNWDLLLDNCRQGINYGVSFIKYNLNSGTIENIKESEKIPILKLHGSLNFLVCTKCSIRLVTYKQKALEVLEEERICPSCGKGKLRILLIPPTVFKDLNSFNQIKEMWYIAYKHISTCDRIRFVGYSLPKGDISFKYLLKIALKYRKVDQKEPIIIEVINYKESYKDRIEFEEHYNRTFDEEIVKLEIPIKFYYSKFSKYPNDYKIA